MDLSDEERESFEITQDDLLSEQNPRRFSKKFTKNKQTYGIWAQDSDEEEEAPRRASSSKKGFGGSGFVSFVSAGIQQGTKKEDEKDQVEEELEGPQITDSSSEEEVQFVSSKQTKKAFDFGSMAGMREQTGSSVRGYEMFGKGAKMAMAMGFQPGKGLGKNLQGIVAPIEAQKRKGRGAIGAYGKETAARIGAPAVVLEPKLEKKPTQAAELKWQKDGTVQRKTEKIEYKYVTAEEILKQKTFNSFNFRHDSGPLGKVKVIDLTGPQERILSGYHALSGQKKPTEEWEETEEGKQKMPQKPTFELPELIYNVNLLVETCEQDILKNDKKIKYNTDRKSFLENEIKTMRKRRGQDSTISDNLKIIISNLNTLKDAPKVSNAQAVSKVYQLKTDFNEEWEMYQLYNVIPAIAIPTLKELLKTWNPLAAPDQYVDSFQDWNTVVGSREDIFQGLLWEAWMPTIRQKVLNSWNVKDAESLIRVIDIWRPLLADWIYLNILDQLILPRIQSAVDEWDPLSDAIPIHSWIHPWLRHLEDKLESVYPTIRKKLSSALTNWHPADASAKKILAPWVPVFSKGSMDTFLIKNILPKLHMAMQELVINPLGQVMEPWHWVMDWLEMLPPKAIAGVLGTSFFPKWLQFLVTWLTNMPNYEDVYRWYTWWKDTIPAELVNDEDVTANLKRGLEIIGRAIQNPGQPYDLMGMLQQPIRQVQPTPPPVQVPPAMAQEIMADVMRMQSHAPSDFRDLIQFRCQELGLIFMPMPNRYYEGKQIYRCGNVFMYISANVIFMQRDGMWFPTSIGELIQTAAMS